MKELGYKLRSLSHSASAASTAEWPHLETGEVAALQEEETLEGLTKIVCQQGFLNFFWFNLYPVELTAIPAPGANCPGETEPVVGAVRESEAGRSFTGHAHISRSMSIPARSSSYSCQQVGTSTSMQQINRWRVSRYLVYIVTYWLDMLSGLHLFTFKTLAQPFSSNQDLSFQAPALRGE